MTNFKVIALGISIGILLGYLSTFISYYDHTKVSLMPDSYDQIKGFPFEISRIPSVNAVRIPPIRPPYPINNLLPTYVFWISGALIFIKWLQTPKSGRTILISMGVGLILIFLDITTGSFCLDGYPIGIIRSCHDTTAPNQPFIYYVLLDYVFWLVTAANGVFFLSKSAHSPNRIIRMLIPPLVLTLLSLSIHNSCGGFFCIFPSGRGFPFAFSQYSEARFFVVDFVFWFIVTHLIIKLFARKKSLSRQ